MCSKGLLKRALPFFATLAVGLFIASFFVTIKPIFSGRGGRHAEMKRMRVELERTRFELEQVKNENLRLRNDLESESFVPDLPVMQHNHGRGRGPEFPVVEAPEFPLDAPHPPLPPVAPRHVR